jgi:hypothetical protein
MHPAPSLCDPARPASTATVTAPSPIATISATIAPFSRLPHRNGSAKRLDWPTMTIA